MFIGEIWTECLWFRTYADEYFLTLVKQAYKYTKQPDIPEITRIETDEIPPSLVSRRLLKNIQLSSLRFLRKTWTNICAAAFPLQEIARLPLGLLAAYAGRG